MVEGLRPWEINDIKKKGISFPIIAIFKLHNSCAFNGDGIKGFCMQYDLKV